MPLKVDKTKSFCSTEHSPKIVFPFRVNTGNCETFRGEESPTIHGLEKAHFLLFLNFNFPPQKTPPLSHISCSESIVGFLVEGKTKPAGVPFARVDDESGRATLRPGEEAALCSPQSGAVPDRAQEEKEL